jgi:hypothetical protein
MPASRWPPSITGASEAMIDHELEHPGQLGVFADIDEFRSHDIGDRSLHQILIARHHGAGEDEAGQMVEL